MAKACGSSTDLHGTMLSLALITFGMIGCDQRLDEGRNANEQSSGSRTSANVIKARVVPFSRAKSVGTQMVLVDWRNTGTTTIRAVDADIIPYDARGNRLESGAKNKPIYAVSDSSPGIAPGETYIEPNGEGFILAPGFAKAARVEVTITEVVESGAY